MRLKVCNIHSADFRMMRDLKLGRYENRNMVFKSSLPIGKRRKARKILADLNVF
jgi:hypothetical protein